MDATAMESTWNTAFEKEDPTEGGCPAIDLKNLNTK
jgi:hypothetical protein